MHVLKLLDSKGDTVQHCVFSKNDYKSTIILRWKRRYGKAFKNATIIEHRHNKTERVIVPKFHRKKEPTLA